MDLFVPLSRERCLVCGVRVVAAVCCDRCADASSWLDSDEEADERARAAEVRHRRQAPREEAS